MLTKNVSRSALWFVGLFLAACGGDPADLPSATDTQQAITSAAAPVTPGTAANPSQKLAEPAGDVTASASESTDASKPPATIPPKPRPCKTNHDCPSVFTCRQVDPSSPLKYCVLR